MVIQVTLSGKILRTLGAFVISSIFMDSANVLFQIIRSANIFITYVTFKLGSISMDNVTLRDTWQGVDNGGPNGPNGNVAQIAQRNGRIRRILYAVLLNYIDTVRAWSPPV